MQGDFSRVTFHSANHFSAVLSQQGRVQLDADTNEQAAILLHYLRTLATDLIGPAGCPREPAGDDPGGFEVTLIPDDSKALPDLKIAAGRMYVDGILVENDDEEGTTYWQQPDGYLVPGEDKLPASPYLVYLRVWERLITAVQDPAIREKALGIHGPDTSARSRVVWQVATLSLSKNDGHPESDAPGEWLAWLRDRIRDPAEMPGLSACAKRADDADVDVCDVAPDSRYRGPENQLYRVEIHSGGPTGKATFKWSRENGSVALPIESLAGDLVTLATLGRDGKLGIEVGDMVEVVDDASASRVADDDFSRTVPRLYQVAQVDHVSRQVTLDGSPGDECGGLGSDPSRHPFLRRWDQRKPKPSDGAIPIEEEGKEHPLEDGVSVWFERLPEPRHGQTLVSDDQPPVRYRPGDYWLIPARVVTGDVEWPQRDGQPVPQEPHGVAYHYAPLALVASDDPEAIPPDLRPRFDRLTAPPPPPAALARVVPEESTEEGVSLEPKSAPKAGAASKTAQPAGKTATQEAEEATQEGDQGGE